MTLSKRHMLSEHSLPSLLPLVSKNQLGWDVYHRQCGGALTFAGIVNK